MARATTGLSYLTFGLVVLGSFVFTVFVIIPQWVTYKATNEKYAEDLKIEVDRQTFLDNLDARLQEMKKYQKETKELSLALPDRFMQSNIWVNIENMASSAGVTIDTVEEVKKVVKSSNAINNTNTAVVNNSEATVVDTALSSLENWDTRIIMKGNYSQIRTFVKNLEDSLILSDLQEISIEQSPSTDKSQPNDVLAVIMVVRTYVQP